MDLATSVSLMSTIIFTFFGLDLFPHLSIATKLNSSFTGLNLLTLKTPPLTSIGLLSTVTNILSDLSVTVPLIT